MFPKALEDSDHATKVAHMAAKVRQFYIKGTPYRVYHGSTNSTRKSPYDHHNIVDISALDRELNVCPRIKVAVVEPNVSMDLLVDETLKVGLLPPIVMEFPGITAGGGFAGTSAESSSYRHGFFHNSVETIEIIIGNGEVVYASEDELKHRDLFRGAAASCGVLGLVTMLVIRLIPAKPYVLLDYIKVHSMEEAIERITQEGKNEDLGFMDGVFFSKMSGILCLGTLTDGISPLSGVKLKRFSRPSDDWFYINAQRQAAIRDHWTELVPIKDYLFRYNRGAFWMGKYTYQYFAIPLNRFTRWALDRYTHTRMMYHALHRSGLVNRYIIQDAAIPYKAAPQLLSYLDCNFQNYPIWICPLRVGSGAGPSMSGLLARKLQSGAADNARMMLNFGVWGPGPHGTDEFNAWNVAFEDKVRSLGGWKWLYGQNFYSEQQFWEIYDKERHDQLREKYHSSHLPSLYLKIKPNSCDEMSNNQANSDLLSTFMARLWAIWPLAGLYGWLQCIVSNEYLLPRKQSVTAKRKIE